MKRVWNIVKKYFIPHEENDHRPHLLRPATVIFVMAIAVAVESLFWFGTSYLAPRSRMFGIVVANVLIDETNQERVAQNLLPLRDNALLDAAAQAKANDMAANSYFAHTSPAGITPWYWFEKAGYNFTAAGENLAVDFTDSQDVTNAWMNSPGHRANILNKGFTEIGMAAASGTFEGRATVFVVEFFGTPSAAPIAFVNETVRAAQSAPPLATKRPTAPAPAPTPSVVTVVATGTNEEPASQPAFIRVAGAATETIPAVAVSAPAARAANPIQALAADPRRVADYIYLAIIGLFAAALVINAFMKLHLRHPRLIASGMLVILVAGLLIVLNEHAAASAVTIL